ncbi:hypothetical protein [Kitasatospora sp. NPDC088346]|uniref:hypothetical protein n=1 Tax=Kitasatospora sp. NPDC088346 TaxID=3364073 RepID=UPI003804F40D
MGTWFFVPDRSNAIGDVRPGYLSRNGERVVLTYCSETLALLLGRIRQLEEEFAPRWGGLAAQAEA